MRDFELLLVSEMKDYFGEDSKRIAHALKVLEMAKKIMIKEEADAGIVVPAAILHDIGIKECERKYNSTAGYLQEKESPAIANAILVKIAYPQQNISEIIEIIANHHSPGKVKTMNFQVLYEADWLVNLGEDFKHLDKKHKEKIINKNFKTKSGTALARELYCL